MSIETDAGTIEQDVEALGRQLGEAIEQLPEYRELQEAQAAVEVSEDAQERIEEFEQLRQEFMLARQTGDASQEDLQELQQAQSELHEIPVMAEYLEAQNRLDAKLEAINDAISEPLDIDFGEEAGGCCED
ncbi:YlbF family regulator [Natronoarchaeum rubrum]|uniref:YlbF family regulator n=1 Tax=Natronoarchaeum rubrum TaxID=755311 RepID=UPI002111AA7A|nr:YlbF family regulator [Natronoarchaeum rubrum]